MWPYQALNWLMCSAILALLGFRSSYTLQHIRFLRTREVHDDLTAVCPQTECGVILSLNGRSSLINIANAEDIIDCCAEAETSVNFLLFRGCHLNKLAAHLDHNIYLALRL